MNILGERVFIYSALVILCGIASVFLGLSSGIWSFVQIAAVIEIMYWIGAFGSARSARSW